MTKLKDILIIAGTILLLGGAAWFVTSGPVLADGLSAAWGPTTGCIVTDEQGNSRCTMGEQTGDTGGETGAGGSCH